MLGQTPLEAKSSAAFLRNYLECMEELPADISKHVTKIRELDAKASNIVNETEELVGQIENSSSEEAKKLLFNRLKEILIILQTVNSEKGRISQIILEKVDTKFRSLETDYQNDISTKTEDTAATSTAKNAVVVQQVLSHLPLKNSSKPASTASSSTNQSDNNDKGNGAKRLRRRPEVEVERAEAPNPKRIEVVKCQSLVNNPTTTREKASSSDIVKGKRAASTSVSTTAVAANTSNSNNNGNNGKKKIKKKKKVSSTSSKQSSTQSTHEEITIEDDNDDEETYCLCQQVSYGEMVLCENDACKIEWFHFSCVSLTSKPKGRWYCPNCRGDRPNVLNKSLRKKYDNI